MTTTTCRHCGDEISLTTIDEQGNVIPTTADDPDAMWINRDEESTCAPDETDQDVDHEPGVTS